MYCTYLPYSVPPFVYSSIWRCTGPPWTPLTPSLDRHNSTTLHTTNYHDGPRVLAFSDLTHRRFHHHHNHHHHRLIFSSFLHHTPPSSRRSGGSDSTTAYLSTANHESRLPARTHLSSFLPLALACEGLVATTTTLLAPDVFLYGLSVLSLPPFRH